MPGNPVVPKLKESVNEFTPVLPVVVNLRDPTLKERHWAQIHDDLGFVIHDPESGFGDEFTISAILDKGIGNHADKIVEVATNSQQESVLEGMMDKMIAVWKIREFDVKPYKDQKDLYILGDTSEVVTDLDDSLVTISTVLGSRFVGGIRELVDTWRAKLILFQETVDEWLACQRNWMYLEVSALVALSPAAQTNRIARAFRSSSRPPTSRSSSRRPPSPSRWWTSRGRPS